MAQTWPVQLQDKVNQEGFNLEFGNTVIQSNPDTGPVKRRRRFTKGIDTYSVTINLHYDDYTIFETFFKTTLNGGVEAFDYTHPILGTMAEFKIVGTPRITKLGGEWFRVAMTWELQN